MSTWNMPPGVTTNDIPGQEDEPVSDAYELEPVAWMAQHGRQPVQATVSKQQAEAWVQAGGDVHALYDGQTLWNAVARAGEIERERLCAAIKAADDKASEADYMLDSDDCISVIRGTWNPGA